jgi:hypothetical protein
LKSSLEHHPYDSRLSWKAFSDRVSISSERIS